MAATKGQVLKYTMFPGFIPRILAFLNSGFANLSYYVALVYSMVRLLPPNHPYLMPQNVGKFGIRHVIAEAANNLIFKKENIDQIVIFFTIILGMALILIQFALLGIAFISSQPAMAGLGAIDPRTLLTPVLDPEQDISFIILDRVFGMVGIFESCIASGTACEDNNGNPISTLTPAYPFPFHLALHSMLRFYSLGILFIAAWVMIYYTITVIAETAATGTPFGQRFNKGWVPVRLVIFFGLLIPLNIGTDNEGLNGAQIITLWTAKHGSVFATNAWTHFNDSLTTTYMGDQQRLVATPNIPELGSLNQFMLTAKTCQIAESVHGARPNDIKGWIVRPTLPTYVTGAPSGPTSSPDAREFVTTDYTTARNFSVNGNIVIRFGELGEDSDGDGAIDEHTAYNGNVAPYCGEIVMEVTDTHEPGSLAVSQAYYEMLQHMWRNTNTVTIAECLVAQSVNTASFHDPTCTDMPSLSYATTQNTTYISQIQTAVTNGINTQRTSADFSVPPEVVEKGWAGAAIWFNKIAQMNGAVTTAVFNIPRPYKWPDVLEATYQRRIQENQEVSGTERYNIRLANGEAIELPDNRHLIHGPMYQAYTFWETEGLTGTPQTALTGNVVIDTINAILGTSGLFSMRKNADVHPLAQLTSLGKSMMEATIRNTVYAVGGTVAGGISGILDPFFSQLASSATSFFFSMVTISVGIAVILYYVLPFLPFIYFLFAVSGWIKSIFEAIVAMPLWALAHIRIDGNGLPGPAASNGYFLILEIFLRPILILFGLLASISIFAAMVSILNNIFDTVVGNVGGFDLEASTAAAPDTIEFYRAPIDEFFFTAVYAIICYMVGLSCFKLIDLIPNNILRWAGVSVSTFQENAGDPASQMSSQIYRGSLLVSNQIKGTTQSNLAIIVGGA